MTVLFVLLQDKREGDEIFVQFVQLNEYLGNAALLVQRVPLSFFYFYRNIQNKTRSKGPLFNFF